MIGYRNYKVWQKSHRLVIDMYKLTNTFPKIEQYNFVSQLNRATLSIPTNIAKGCGRETQKELIRFLYISSGSAHEVEYLMFAATELGFIDKELSTKLLSDIAEVKKNACITHKSN